MKKKKDAALGYQWCPLGPIFSLSVPCPLFVALCTSEPQCTSESVFKSVGLLFFPLRRSCQTTRLFSHSYALSTHTVTHWYPQSGQGVWREPTGRLVCRILCHLSSAVSAFWSEYRQLDVAGSQCWSWGENSEVCAYFELRHGKEYILCTQYSANYCLLSYRNCERYHKTSQKGRIYHKLR